MAHAHVKFTTIMHNYSTVVCISIPFDGDTSIHHDIQ